MTKVSIIVPIFNAESYLKECLDSILNQSESDIEVICINDGSTDNSFKILQTYVKHDNRIKVISQENKGVSYARNVGLEYITGEYVCFVDSDDCIEKTFCNDLIKAYKNNIDLVCGGHVKLNSLHNKISRWLPSMDYSNNVMKDILSFTKHRNVSQKLFKTSIIKENNIRFAEDLNYMEDALFLISYLYYCRSIASVKKPLYVVRINFNSLCRNKQFEDRRAAEKEKAVLRINNIINEYNSKK